jgi:large subunit ribosomal protein L10
VPAKGPGTGFTAVCPRSLRANGLSGTAGCRKAPGQMRTEAVDRAQKSELVSNLNQVFANTRVVVVARYSGLTVAQMTALRSRMRGAGANLKVAKNRLVKLALKGTDAEHISGLFEGPTVIAYSDDPVAAPKVATDFAKTNEKFVLLGGALGKTNLDSKGIEALATMPSLDELRAKLVGLIKTPGTRIAGVLQAPAGQLARVFGAYAKRDEAA